MMSCFQTCACNCNLRQYITVRVAAAAALLAHGAQLHAIPRQLLEGLMGKVSPGNRPSVHSPIHPSIHLSIQVVIIR